MSDTKDWIFYPVKDEPVDNASLLGTSKLLNTLYGFLTSKGLISPLVIAINGEWGSGKTSLILTLKKRLDQAGLKTAFFDAWKYEYSDPAAALIWNVSEQLTLGKAGFKQRSKELGKLALDIFTRKTIDIPLGEVESHFRGSVHAVNELGTKLEKLVEEAIGLDKKVVVFIDDLDRCSLENVTQVLEAIKLFLNVPNFVFIMAIDIDKIKLAWHVKYGKAESIEKEGLRYLEKIIQLQLGLPQPNREQIQEYVSSIFPSMPKDVVELVSLTDLDNPRRIKRLLNLISLRCNIEGETTGKKEAALLWTVLEAMTWSYGSNSNISFLYEQFAKQYGRAGFYDFIFLAASWKRWDFERDYQNYEKFKPMSQMRNNSTIIHRYSTIVASLIKDIDKEKNACIIS